MFASCLTNQIPIYITWDSDLFSQGTDAMQQQQMPFRQQKSTKKGSQRYGMFGPNHILVTFMWDEERSPGHENVGVSQIDANNYWVRQN